MDDMVHLLFRFGYPLEHIFVHQGLVFFDFSNAFVQQPLCALLDVEHAALNAFLASGGGLMSMRSTSFCFQPTALSRTAALRGKKARRLRRGPKRAVHCTGVACDVTANITDICILDRVQFSSYTRAPRVRR